jgi:hypothetical protein
MSWKRFLEPCWRLIEGILLSSIAIGGLLIGWYGSWLSVALVTLAMTIMFFRQLEQRYLAGPRPSRQCTPAQRHEKDIAAFLLLGTMFMWLTAVFFFPLWQLGHGGTIRVHTDMLFR